MAYMVFGSPASGMTLTANSSHELSTLPTHGTAGKIQQWIIMVTDRSHTPMLVLIPRRFATDPEDRCSQTSSQYKRMLSNRLHVYTSTWA